MIQVDGHYMLLHAWALWALQAEDTPEKAAFIEESWPTVSAYASYFINDQYIDSALKLVRNPNYEHTGAGGGMIETYDLITNAFMSQALHELSTIAQQRGDKEQADLWKKTSELIVEGVEENLVMTASGKEIYAELLNNKKELSTGLSFVSWGPVAAEWYGINSERMANTYEIYRKYGSLEFGNISMLNIYFDLKSNKRSNHVVGKAVAWELMYNRAIGDEERVEELLTFMRENSTPGGVYPENWVVDGRISDVGNQEQVSWILYAMIKLFPQLTVDPSAPESSDPSSPNVSSSVSDSSSQVGSHISDPGNSSVQAPTSAASQDDSSHSVTQSAVGSEPESDSPVTGHTIGILSALLAAISAMCVVAFRNKTGKQPG